MRYRIGIDVGGTFTDFLLLGSQGETAVYKVLSTPEDPSVAVLTGLSRMANDRNLKLDQFLAKVDIIVHGTTVTTNAVLTGNIAKTGLLTTRGFRDALEMRKGVREETYDNKAIAVEPLVPRWLRLPVTERVTAEGLVRADLDVSDLDNAMDRFRADGVEAIAICFMHSYANPSNEEKAVSYVSAAMPEIYLSPSYDVLRQVRFYDRVSTTVLNASVGPILVKYLESLTKRLADAEYRNMLLIMQSNGGVTAPKTAMRLAASTLLSGPAAAPVAGLAYTALHGENSFITVDMGGTSLDAALIRDGTPHMTSE
ncbi:MAG: hydantoinase/oxoprolinase family protein, partial [Fimbriimonadaceae bacterium]|nr:hydantoinase/oxoprolinase family protein [Alphaproteobacteria bacterium]